MNSFIDKNILELRDISLSFGGVKAINQISFSVREGEICSLIGPNGAGKSSLLNIINGVYRPESGEITLSGIQRKFMTPRLAANSGIARTFQNIALFKRMNVVDNLLTGRNLKFNYSWWEQALGVPRAKQEQDEHREKVERMIDFLHLQPYRKIAVGKLPYGLQKRVELGRALTTEPQLLLLDEPMAGMNFEEKLEMCDYIIDANRNLGTTVVLIEHDIGVVMDISEHIIVLDYGRKIADGLPEDVRKHPDVISAYTGTRH